MLVFWLELVLDQVVDVHTHFTGLRFGIVDANHDAGGIHIVHNTAAGGGDYRARIDGGDALDTRANKGFFRAQHRYRLALHVGAHQCAVGIVVLQERN